jgi:putative heme transporter
VRRHRPWQARHVANEVRADRAVGRATVLRAGLTPAAAILLVAAVVAGFALADAFGLAHRTIGWVVACSVVALLIDPVVDVVARAVPRWVAVIVVLLAVLGIISALVVGLAHDLLRSLDDLKENAPVAARSLEQQHTWARQLGLGKRVTDFVGDLDDRVRKTTVSKALGTAPSYVVTGVLMLFLLAYGRRYFEGFADQFPPERAARIRTVGGEASSRGRRYLLVVVGESIANGLVVGLVCWAVGLPAAVSLGFAVGVLTVLPLFGVLVGGIPALLLAFGLLAWWQAVLVLLVLLALQAIEIVVVRPNVDARTVRVGPTVPIIVGLLGFELYGVGGAVYGIAVAIIGLAALDAAGRLRGDDPPGEVNQPGAAGTPPSPPDPTPSA